MENNHHSLIMEITVISAQGLKNTSSPIFFRRLRPFIILTTDPPKSYRPETTSGDKHSQVYQTRVYDEGSGLNLNPTWGDKFDIPLDPTFFTNKYSSIYLQIYTKRSVLMMGNSKSQLGWTRIPAADILDGFSPVGSVRHLSYRVREKDGSRSEGVVNIAVKLQGQVPPAYTNVITHPPESDVAQYQTTVIGVPVAMLPIMG